MEIYIRIYFVCWFFTAFDPVQSAVDWYFSRFKDIAIVNSLWTALSCQKCLTFWIALLITNNFVIAAVLSAIAQLHSKIIKP